MDRTKQQERRQRIKAAIRSLKESNPCQDCGEFYPYYVMHYDHRDPTTKTRGVGELASEQSLAKCLTEIAKCDLVCANCHAEREHQRKNAVVALRVKASA